MKKTQIRRIFLDIDDVLCDCTGACMRHMGLFDWVREDHNVLAERDIYKMYQMKTGILFEPHVWWEHFKREFWAGIDPTPWCHDLIDLCCEYVDPEDIALLSVPTKCGDCLAGKHDWIEEFMPKFLHRQYVITPRKVVCAAPGNVLIDDARENTKPFGDAGGWSITFPQPWNQCREQQGAELEYVRGWLDYYQNESYT
jgi:5'(3')-deoxyribonucleotidase